MNNTQKLEFNKKININFEWWEITWNAWMLLFEEFCNKMNILPLLEEYLPEIRKGNLDHIKSEIIYQKIFRIISWITSNNNYVFQKQDPVFQEIHNNKIASSATCSRLENTFNYSDVSNLRKVQLKLEEYNLLQTKPEEMIVDIDTTNDPASENLEFARFNGHYGLNGFSPIVAFNWINGDFLRWFLKPWNYYCSTLSYNFILDLIKFYQEKEIKNISFRLDSAFWNPKIYELFEENLVDYYIKLKANSALYSKVKWKWIRWISTFEEFEYQAQSWNKPRRVIACIDWKQNKNQQELFPTYSFIITNNKILSKEEVFSMYNWRATIEKSIEEWKNWFEMDHLSHKDFRVNSTIFQIHLLAIQIAQLFRKFCLSKVNTVIQSETKFQESKKITKKFKKQKVWRKQINLPSISTIRKQLLCISAKIVRTWRQIYYKCASSFIFKKLFMNTLERVQNLDPLII